MVYVLDANVIIHYLKNDFNVKKNFRRSVSEGHTLLLPRAVDYEICRGLEILSATKKAAIYQEITDPLGWCKIVDMGEIVWDFAKKIYVDLYQNGFTVGEIDILIGAFCLLNDHTLVTSNTKDFINMKSIRLENWSNS